MNMFEKAINKLIGRIKFKLETTFNINNDLDLDNYCQFLYSQAEIDLALYKRTGVLVVKNLFTEKEITRWRNKALNEVKTTDYKKLHGQKEYWLTNLGNLSCSHEIITHKNLLGILDQLIGPKRVFVGHDSVSINYSIPGLHDDNKSYLEIHGTLDIEEINTVRVLFNANASSSFPQKFGFISGSHKRRSEIDKSSIEKDIKWVEVSHGTAIFFDPRIIHSAEILSHEKFMFVLTYDKEDQKVEEIFWHTLENRNQGVGLSARFWAKLSRERLVPNFIQKELDSSEKI